MASSPRDDAGQAAAYTTRSGRNVRFTEKMREYQQQQQQDKFLAQLEEEINKTERELQLCQQELSGKIRAASISPAGSRTTDPSAKRDDSSRTSVKRHTYYGRDRYTGQPRYTSSPAAGDHEKPVATVNQTWPSAIKHVTGPISGSVRAKQRSSHPSDYDNPDVGYKPSMPDVDYKPPMPDVGYKPPTDIDYKPPRLDIGYQPPRHAMSDVDYKPPMTDVGYRLPEDYMYMPRNTPTVYSTQGQVPDGGKQRKTVSAGSHDDDATGLLHRLADLLSNKRENLPKMEPDTFTGDMLQFPVWIKAFNAIIESHTDSPAERLYFLGRYTSGAAREAIQGFLSLDDDDAYIRAKNTLMSRYGDRYKVSEAFKKKLNSWPTIRPGDPEGLRRFSDFLQHCNSAMMSITYLDSLNSAEENRKLIEKLPKYLADRWNRVIDRWLYGPERGQDTSLMMSSGCYPPFSTFCQFISDESRIACGPGYVYSTQSTKKAPQTQSQFGQMSRPGKPKVGSFASQTATATTDTDIQSAKKTKKDGSTGASTNKTAGAQQLQCLHCKGQHYLDQCQGFLAKTAEDKKVFASSHGLCFGCLRRGHLFSKCKRRNFSLMKDGTAAKETEKPPDSTDAQATANKAVSYRVDAKDVSITDNSCAHSMIVPVMLHHSQDPDSEVFTYALLDNQSDACFVAEGVLQQLNVATETVTLEVTTVLAKQVVESQVVKGLVVTGLQEKNQIPLPATYSRSFIPANEDLIPRPETVHRWPHLKDVPLHPLQDDAGIGLLIGINCSKALMPREVIAAGDEDPYAVRTLLGWGVTGNMSSTKTNGDEPQRATHFAFRTSSREITPVEIRKMFELEFSETSNSKKMSVEDGTFLKKMEAGLTKREDGHLELPLPLKKDDLRLPNNKALAVKRLQSLKKKMAAQDKYSTDYKKFMADMITKGFAEKVPEDADPPEGRIWYLPHHGVYHPKKPQKIRVVFNCSAEFDGQTLNENLLSGPDMINGLTGILVRFRQKEVALICDIEAMFHQVKVPEEHRDLLRFVWWPDGDISRPPEDYRMTVHLFGATSSPACANYALKAAAEDYKENAANFVKKNFYVDDGLISVTSPEEAVQLVTESRELCKNGGFNLTKFLSNDKSVMKQLPPEIRGKDVQNFDFQHDRLPVERTLGVQWCAESDTFQFHVLLQDKPLTRRGLLSQVSSIFDPLGLISPFLLTAKKLLQELCKNNVDWDDPLPEDIAMKWEQWRGELLKLTKLQIPRCYKAPDQSEIKQAELHHFSDASQEAYGQCSYLRLVDKDDKVSTRLTLAKSRVAPLKMVTIPRLELTAALTSVRVSTFLNEELDFENITNVYWTDSTVVLGYIANDSRRFHVYVANRIQQIRDSTSVEDWCHVSTKDNPADVASRGATADQLMSNTTWWQGPAFLSTPDAVPRSSRINATLSDSDPEVKRVTAHNTQTTQKECDLPQRLTRFSTWQRAKKAVALCIRYTKKLRSRVAEKRTNPGLKLVKGTYSPPTVDELQNAEKTIIGAVQTQAFSEEVELLSTKTKGQDISRTRRHSRLHRLDPYMDSDGLIRVGGRIRRANIPRDLAHPVVLPSQGHVTTMIIRHHHERARHAGRGITLNEIRASGYWIVKLRTAVASYVWRCVTCRKLRGSRAGQKMADLPVDRLDPAPPFTNTGVDMFGPFYVKEGRSERKRWGCMFTCMVTRAVHIEVTHSLSTDSFLNAYRRFVARRGPVRQIRSDRGTNFVGAKNELQAALNEMDQDRIQRTLSQDGCDWVTFKMNVPSASHMGGIWERMIRSARTVLSALLNQHGSQLDDELLVTFMAETEAVINGRPLTHLEDEREPLSPSQLLTLKSKVVQPLPGHFVREDLFCRRRWRRVQFLANEFWTRWRREYLPTLQERAKWQTPECNLQKDDIVLLTTEDVPRAQWPKGIVIATFPSADNLVRKVTVRTRTSTLDRPIHKLILLYRPGIPTKEPTKD